MSRFPSFTEKSVELADGTVRALDLIGWDLSVPEPSTYAAAGAMLVLIAGQWYRRNRLLRAC